MRCQRPLPVGGSLHSPENLFDIPAQAPRVRPRRFCQAHLAKHGEARNIMPRARPRHFAQPSLHRIPRHREVLRSEVRAGFARVLHEPPVDRGEPLLGNLAAFRLDPVQFRAIPNLARTQVRRNSPNALLHILAAQAQNLAAVSHSSNHHVNMRVLGVVVFSRNPFEVRSQILLHLRDQFARQPRQVNPVPKFRRDDQLPELLIACGLPGLKFPRDVHSFGLPAESHRLRVVLKCCALAREIPPVRFPLPPNLVLQIRHPDRAALMVRTRAFPFSAWRAVACLSAAPGIVHEKPESARPRGTFVPGNARLWRS